MCNLWPTNLWVGLRLVGFGPFWALSRGFQCVGSSFVGKVKQPYWNSHFLCFSGQSMCSLWPRSGKDNDDDWGGRRLDRGRPPPSRRLGQQSGLIECRRSDLWRPPTYPLRSACRRPPPFPIHSRRPLGVRGDTSARVQQALSKLLLQQPGSPRRRLYILIVWTIDYQ